jgi:predicted Zn-dependent peptidase
VAGNVEFETVKKLSEKWFGPIPSGKDYVRKLPQEPLQKEQRILEMEATVPSDALYKAYHIPARLHPDYHAADLLSDIIGRSNSSRLYQKLLKEDEIFNSINAYVTGSADPGLLIISGKVNNGISLEEADKAVEAVIASLKSASIDEVELSKVKNQAESTLVFSEVELLNRAMNLAYGALLGNPDLINEEPEKIQQVNVDDIRRLANTVLAPENSSTIYYRAKK